jgi:hypothetical protein
MDYEELISNLDVDAVVSMMEKLGADRHIDKGTHIIFPTICHNEDASEASMKLYFYKDTKLFVCYTSCGNMSIFKFLKHYYETRGIEYEWYNDIYMVVRDCANFKGFNGFVVEKYKSMKDRYGAKRKEIQLPEYSPNVLECFVREHPVEWLEDGISAEAMDKFDISYSIAHNKIIIPHYDANGRLIGIRGRALNEWEVENVGKYTPLKIEQNWYKHPLSMNLYGLNVTKENIKQHGVCFLVESEKAVMQMESFSFPNCSAAVCGSNFNKYQLNILMKTCCPAEIVLCFDKEELPGEDRYFYKLYDICKKYGQYCNFSFIYDREGLLNLKDSPTDRGEEVFTKLLEKRVRVK